MSLNFKVSGSGQPLLLIHGLFGSLENLAGIARPLSEQFTVYSIDLPNHGKSPHSNETSLALMAEQVGAWLDEQGLQQVYLVGHSLGGKVCMELALRQPERSLGLVVVDIAPVHYEPHHNDVFAGLLAVNPEQVGRRNEVDALLKEYVPEIAVRSFLLKNLVKNPDGGFQWRMNLPVIYSGYPELIKGNTEGLVYSGMTMFLKGGNSEYILPEHREEILSRFPQTSLKVIQNTGHWLHAEKPDIVARIMRNFLGEN